MDFFREGVIKFYHVDCVGFTKFPTETLSVAVGDYSLLGRNSA